MELGGKTAIVTGASSGIGASTVRKLREAGVRVVGGARRVERIEADLTLGWHAELIGELEVLIAEHPHRERLRGQLMLALYRAGRQADALDAFRTARDALDELGLEPGSPLRQLERAILTHDESLALLRLFRQFAITVAVCRPSVSRLISS